jgi:hypothetical protein
MTSTTMPRKPKRPPPKQERALRRRYFAVDALYLEVGQCARELQAEKARIVAKLGYRPRAPRPGERPEDEPDPGPPTIRLPRT